MADSERSLPFSPNHSHVFLGEGHERAERSTMAVVWLCMAMMVLEIGGGVLFGSIALVADGLHMSTHAGALLLAALAYRYARRFCGDPRFTFGTGKLGDLAGFTSAIILAMIALLIGYESFVRLFAPVPIHFREAIPIAVLGLLVNIGSVWLLSGGAHGHDHAHGHGHINAGGHTHTGGHAHGSGQRHESDHAHDAVQRVETQHGAWQLSIFEDGAPPRFRLRAEPGQVLPQGIAIETERSGGARQIFTLRSAGAYLESVEDIAEPHAFAVRLLGGSETLGTTNFEEPVHAQAAAGRDNNMRAAIVHVMADAAVSMLVIVGLVLARAFGWLWMDPLAGLVGAAVIASWAYGLVRDTGAILLDMNPDRGLAEKLRQAIEDEGDRLTDLHLWRLGPGHLGAIIAVSCTGQRNADYYRARLARFRSLSHLTIEVQPA